MDSLVYISSTLSHAYAYSVTSGGVKDKATNGQNSNIAYLRRQQKLSNGVYKSKYYDPVKRHERYMRERESLGIGKGIAKIGKGSGGKGSGGKGSGGKGSGGKGSGGKGSGGKGSSNTLKAISDTINSLREESSLNSEAQQEAARRKIEDLRKELKSHIDSFTQANSQQEGINVSEIRGKIQSIKGEIEKTGGDLNKWISEEKKALEDRIAAVHKANGMEYKSVSNLDKQTPSEARNKEVQLRADSIYKKKS